MSNKDAVFCRYCLVIPSQLCLWLTQKSGLIGLYNVILKGKQKRINIHVPLLK